MRIFCDFDGTISSADTAALVFSSFAGPIWEEIEARWEAGDIDAATCMIQQVEQINAPLVDIEAVLDGVGLRSGFAAFLEWSKARCIPVSIVSDGVDHFIRYFLERNGVAGVPVIANRLVAARHTRWTLEFPWHRAACAVGAGTCKCSIVNTGDQDGPTVYIGDGKSDFCVASKADILFATARLRAFCVERAIPFFPFESFADVQAILEDLSAPASASQPRNPRHAFTDWSSIL
jgi:2-hydroxy-3-keto-5-methylthiopentenyl-1-phosphate phosphatase